MTEQIDKALAREYKAGFVSDIESERLSLVWMRVSLNVFLK